MAAAALELMLKCAVASPILAAASSSAVHSNRMSEGGSKPKWTLMEWSLAPGGQLLRSEAGSRPCEEGAKLSAAI